MSNYQIDIKEIPVHAGYEGYLWWSDSTKPRIYKQNHELVLPRDVANPFIIEGNIIDRISNISYFITLQDGAYQVFRYDLKELEQYESTQRHWLASFNEADRICFREFWIPEKDPFCNGFEVLKPAMNVFVGFNCKEASL
jgi:CRISPR type III-associated protein (TIGR04423 family)